MELFFFIFSFNKLVIFNKIIYTIKFFGSIFKISLNINKMLISIYIRINKLSKIDIYYSFILFIQSIAILIDDCSKYTR